MNYLHAIILGVVEGITEFLPISSTGHLILASTLLHLADSEFLKSFEIIIQLGAMLAVLGLYIKRIPQMVRMVPKLIIAFIPTAVVGLTLYPLIKQWLGNDQIVLWSLLIGGVVILAVEWFMARKQQKIQTLEDVSYKQAFAVGLFQSVAVIPGVSRSAATILGGMFIGIPRATIVEFSFLLALPTIAAATGLDLLRTPLQFSGSEWGMLAVGFGVSFVVALLVLRWFIKYISRHSFLPFGIYRIAIALLGFWLI
jgi:undecaprenyl-diphosphatase